MEAVALPGRRSPPGSHMNTTGTLIGFGHRAQVGKDTAAAAAGFHPYSFADAIRTIAKRVNPFIREAGEHLNKVFERLDWEEAKVRYPEIRALLQDLGQACRVELGADVWLSAAMTNVEYHLGRGLNCAITDLRFPNEAKAIRHHGGILVRIDRPGVPKMSHPTECALDDWSDWDHVIENDGTLDEFEATVRALFSGS